MSSEQIVRDFCAAWERRDIDELLGFFTEDAVYHNIPTDPAKGHDAIRAVMMLFVPMSKGIEFRIDRLAADGDVVFTERVDSFVMEKGTIALPSRASSRSGTGRSPLGATTSTRSSS